MSIPSSDDLRVWLKQLVASNTFLQVAPFAVLFLFPLIVLRLIQPAQQLVFLVTNAVVMVLESIGILPWNWGRSSSGPSSSRSPDKRKSKKKHHPRTRAEQLAMNKSENETDDDADYYPGLVNISGTYCFMNSTLQAMASLSYLQPQIDTIHEKAVELDVPSPVIDALRDLFDELNTPQTHSSSLRPLQIIQALSGSKSRSSALLSSREHQDAQELFQLITECLKNEISAIDKERSRDRGFGSALSLSPALSTSQHLSSSQSQSQSLSQAPRHHPVLEAGGSKWIRQSVFDGLTANRRSCMQCGYTEAVMHFAFDSWQLSVPHVARCSLEECLDEYTRLEILQDCICRKCSLLATHRRLVTELKTLEETLKSSTISASSPNGHASKASAGSHYAKLGDANGDSPKKATPSKKRRAKEVAKMEARVRLALEEGRIEDDLKDVRMEKVTSRASSKQAMIARPPPVLALHLNRSSFGHYASKNNAFVEFPEILDLTPYTTSGNLSTVPSVPISTPAPSLPIQLALPPRSRTPTPAAYEKVHERVLYRLSAVVCHYGSHSFGHYVCYRRRPRPKSSKRRWTPPTILDPLFTRQDDVDDDEVGSNPKNGSARPDDDDGLEYFGKRNEIVWADEDPSNHRPGRGWLRISDDSVRECGIETVLREGSGAFMLYYERIRFAHTSPYPSMAIRRKNSVGPVELGAESTISVRRDYSPRSSEETLRPELRTLQLNMVNGVLPEGHGSMQSLVSEVGVGVAKGKCKEDDNTLQGQTENGTVSLNLGASGSLSMWTPGSSPSTGPRVVRSVAAGRGRSTSSIPSSDSDASRTTASPIPNGLVGKPSNLPIKKPLGATSKPLSSSAPSPSTSFPNASSSEELNSLLPSHHPPPSPIVGLRA